MTGGAKSETCSTSRATGKNIQQNKTSRNIKNTQGLKSRLLDQSLIEKETFYQAAACER